jgi:hypothetical protein
MDAKPLLEKLLYSNGEMTIDEKMVVVFFIFLTKWENATIFPTMPSEATRRPKPILHGKQA